MKRIAFLLVCSLLFHGAGRVHAHAPSQPVRYLTGGCEADILQMPEPYFTREARRLLNLTSATVTRYEGDHEPAPIGVEAHELKAALDKSATPKADDIVVSYTAMRRIMTAEEEYGKETPQFDPAAWQSLLTRIPSEFALYVQGAAAYKTKDYDKAIAAWNQLLSLPANQRQYRSVWAAYMIGKAWLRAESDKAIPAFQQCRALAAQGFKDPLGLAPDSFGWEARANLKSGAPQKALRQYVEMGLRRNELDVLSISVACGKIFEEGKIDANLVHDPLCRPVLTAAILTNYIGNPGDNDKTSGSPQLIERWMELIQESGIKLPSAEAEDLAWISYNEGKMELAAKWLEAAQSHTLIGNWIQSKLLLHDGRVEEAIDLLKTIEKETSLHELWSRNDSFGIHGEFLENVEYYGSDMGTPSAVWPYGEICAQLGVLLLGEEQYVDAFDYYARSGFWGDAAYLAERVLTPDELESYLKSHKDVPALQLTRHMEDFNNGATVWANFNYVLARRLARMKQWDRARPCFVNAGMFVEQYDRFVKDIKIGQDERINSHVRAKALYEAGLIAREYGMELFGTELEPDLTIFSGEFLRWAAKSPMDSRLGIQTEYNNDSTPKPANIAKYLSSGAEERRRILDSAAYPDNRFHYRWYAAELMWQASQLLPDNDPLLAEALWRGGRFIHSRDSLGSDKFYKALVWRCPKQPIGQLADKMRALPDEIEELDVKKLITIYVNAAGGDDRNDGSSWAKARKSIQPAIDMLRETGGSVWVAAGAYPESIRLATNVAVMGGFRGNETALDQRILGHWALSQIEAGAAADGHRADHAVVLDSITSCALDGFWIKGGNAHSLDDGSLGGGIFCRNLNASCEIRNCIVSGCKATSKGGGMFMDRSSPHIDGCTLIDNQCADSGGGLACIRGSNPRIEDCVVANNSARYGLGGGIFIEDSAPELNRCWISGNWVESMMGGGIYLSSASPTIANCMITGNTGGTYGGGLAANDQSAPVLQFCTIVDNKANLDGGGVLVGDEARGSFVNCIFDHNHNDAIFDTGYRKQPLTIENCLFNRNTPAHFNSDTTKSVTLARDLNRLLPGARDNFGGDPMFLFKTRSRKGTWTSKPVYHPQTNTTTLVDRKADFSNLAGKVMLVRANKKYRAVSFIVAVNSPTSIEVLGDLTRRTAKKKPYRLLDYRLRNGSIALSHGKSIAGIGPDLDGTPRPADHADVGAYEAPANFAPAPDHTAPVSAISPIPPAHAGSRIEFPFTYTDEQSDMKQAQLFYRKGEGTWTAGDVTTTTTRSLTFDASGLGDGQYSFYTVATDKAGNVERPRKHPSTRILMIKQFAGKQVYVDVNAKGTGLGQDWKNAMLRIDDALILAAGFQVPDVWVAAGTYHESVNMQSNVALWGGFTGTETALTQRNALKNITIIDARRAQLADGGEADRAVQFKAVQNARLDGFTVTGGHFSYRQSHGCSGSGIFCQDADDSNVIDHCRIENNVAVTGAGGIDCEYSAVRVNHCMITGNRGYYGGGIFYHNGTAHVANSIISNNVARCGGGVCLETYLSRYDKKQVSVSTPIISNCTIVGNKLDKSQGTEACAGGIQIYISGLDAPAPVPQPVITNCIFARNGNDAISGVFFSGNPTIHNCLFYDNAGADLAYMGRTGFNRLQGADRINNEFPSAAGNLTADPKFVSTDDYHVQAGSAAIDTGTNTNTAELDNIADDLDGVSRPRDGDGKGAGKTGDGSDFDIGAFEYSQK